MGRVVTMAMMGRATRTAATTGTRPTATTRAMNQGNIKYEGCDNNNNRGSIDFEGCGDDDEGGIYFEGSSSTKGGHMATRRGRHQHKQSTAHGHC